MGSATDEDAEELTMFVKKFREDVIDWLKKNHPELLQQRDPERL